MLLYLFSRTLLRCFKPASHYLQLDPRELSLDSFLVSLHIPILGGIRFDHRQIVEVSIYLLDFR
jgi:hypothetical protein